MDENTQIVQLQPASKAIKHKLPPRELAVIRLPAFEEVVNDPVLYAHANRILHLETNPGNARAMAHWARTPLREAIPFQPDFSCTSAGRSFVDLCPKDASSL